MQDGLINGNKITGGGDWLNGVKGILCFFVFLGHFYIDFFWENVFKTPSLINNFFLLIFSGCVTVPFFCCISGFLLEKKRPAKLYNLMLEIFKRFLRFEIPLLPIFFLIILFVRKTNFFDFVNILVENLENKFLNHYPSEAHFTHLYKKPFYALNSYITPLWMIKSLFYGGVLIYCKNYCINLIKKYKPSFLLWVEFLSYIFLIIFFKSDIPGLSVVFGSLISRFFSSNFMTRIIKSDIYKFIKCLIIAITILFLILHAYLYLSRVMTSYVLEDVFNYEGMFLVLIMFICMLLTNIKNFFLSKLFQKLGKHSFGIYVTHDLLIGTFSCASVYYLQKTLGFNTSVLITFLLTILVVYIISVIYTIGERFCSLIIKKIISFLAEN